MTRCRCNCGRCSTSGGARGTVSRTYEEAALRAAALGYDGTVGSDTMVRDYWPNPPRSRERCNCGCGKRATHVGGAAGLALRSGCEWSIRRWVREGRQAHG